MATIRCRQCQGTGEITIPEHLADTLKAVTKREQSVDDIRKKLGDSEMTVNGVANRLKVLWEEGFVSRRRSGRFYLYRKETRDV